MPYAVRHALETLGMGRILIAGSFITVSSSNPTVVTGKGFTVTRDGTGDYTVTLDETPADIEAVFCDVDLKTGTNDYQLRRDIDDEGAAAFSVLLETAADVNAGAYAAADDAGSRINFLVIARNTSLDA